MNVVNNKKLFKRELKKDIVLHNSRDKAGLLKKPYKLFYLTFQHRKNRIYRWYCNNTSVF